MKIVQQKDYLNRLVRIRSKEGDPYGILERELGPVVREYRRKWALAEKRKKIFKYPLHLNIELSYGCNLSCSFCIFSLPKEQSYYRASPKDKISFDKYCEIINEGVRNGLYSIALNGYNEPLIKRDIVKYINYAKDKGVLDISLHTNGLSLTTEFSKELIMSGLTSIMFSVDAAKKETYKKIRNSHSFDRIVRNVIEFIDIKRSLNYTLPLTRVSFVETKANIEELDEFLNFWKDKADYFALQSFTNPFVGLPGYSKAERNYRLKDAPFTKCPGPYQRLTIACNGEVYPCCSYYGLYLPVGNIYRDSIYNVWNSSSLKTLRKNVNINSKQPLACKKCMASYISDK